MEIGSIFEVNPVVAKESGETAELHLAQAFLLAESGQFQQSLSQHVGIVVSLVVRRIQQSNYRMFLQLLGQRLESRA